MRRLHRCGMIAFLTFLVIQFAGADAEVIKKQTEIGWQLFLSQKDKPTKQLTFIKPFYRDPGLARDVGVRNFSVSPDNRKVLFEFIYEQSPTFLGVFVLDLVSGVHYEIFNMMINPDYSNSGIKWLEESLFVYRYNWLSAHYSVAEDGRIRIIQDPFLYAQRFPKQVNSGLILICHQFIQDLIKERREAISKLEGPSYSSKLGRVQKNKERLESLNLAFVGWMTGQSLEPPGEKVNYFKVLFTNEGGDFTLEIRLDEKRNVWLCHLQNQ